MLTNKQVWGMNLDQKGSKLGFLGCNWMSSRKETQKLGFLFWCNSPGELMARCGELLNTTPNILGVPSTWGSIQTFLNDSFDVFNCCYTFLTFGNIKWIGLRLVLSIELKLF